MAPLVGFNDNIQYGGSTYHVQTEDSGPRRPHVITHLFADGGRIVTSTKTSYKEHVDADDADERVRDLMRSQHKAMLAALQTGEFDELIDPSAAAPKPPRPTPAAAAGAGSRSDTAQAAPLPLTSAVAPAGGVTDAAPSPPAAVSERQDPGGDAAGAVDSEREATRTQVGRRKPVGESAPSPSTGASAPGTAHEQVGQGLSRGRQPPGKEEGGSQTDAGAGRRPGRKPTPIRGAGAYRYVASGAEEDDDSAGPQPQRAEQAAPAPRRRYPDTSPGRAKVAARKAAAAARAGASGRRLLFGERFLTDRTLDQIIIDYLSSQADS